MGPVRLRTTDRTGAPKPVRHSLGPGRCPHLHLTEPAEYTYGSSQTRKDTQIASVTINFTEYLLLQISVSSHSVYFILNRNSCMQTVYILSGRGVLWRLIWVCTVCHLSIYGTLRKYGFRGHSDRSKDYYENGKMYPSKIKINSHFNLLMVNA